MKETQAVPTKLIDEVFEQWKAGGRLPALTKLANSQLERPVTLGAVRYWLIRKCGGQQAYVAAAAKRDEEHPRPKSVPPGREAVQIDDSQVPTITKGLISEGWQSERLSVHGRTEDVIVSPDGARYVHAESYQRADLLFVGKNGQLRLRLLVGSVLEKVVKREKKLVKKGEEQRRRRAGFEPGDSLRRLTKKVRRKK